MFHTFSKNHILLFYKDTKRTTSDIRFVFPKTATKVQCPTCMCLSSQIIELIHALNKQDICTWQYCSAGLKIRNDLVKYSINTYVRYLNYALLIIAELPNDELTGNHTLSLPPLCL